MKGKIIDIKKFTIHDGPGIRSTVFLKGCYLKCIWCHNPEGIDCKVNLWYFESKCIKCHKCISACQNNALSTHGSPLPHILIDKAKCSNAGNCVAVCPTTALCFDGQEITSEEVVKTLMDDKPFYNQSGGGITISGGDPLYQSDFSLEILSACKRESIHTAIETCMYAWQEVLEQFIPYVDLFIVDLKLFDSNEHERYTGVRNELIKSNFENLASRNVKALVRIPLIPGITATSENIKNIATYVHSMSKNIPIELMNYNILAENKYRLMNKKSDVLRGMHPFSEKELDQFHQIVKKAGAPLIKETKTKKQQHKRGVR